jgi:hypothetical protein
VKSIATKLSQVGKAIGWGVPKDGRNQSQNYDYTSAANVRMCVAPQLAARHIAVSSVIEVLSQDHPVSKSGAAQHRVMLRATLTFVDGDSGETLSVQGIGCGMDSGDKAPMKAMTAAEKYAYVSAFTLAMGEDPEVDAEHDRDNAPIGAPLKSYAYGPEEKKRAAAQADEARVLSDGLINDFRTLTSADDALQWIAGNVEAAEARGKAEHKRIVDACAAHCETGIVEGMNGAGFKDAWKAALLRARDARKEKAA